MKNATSYQNARAAEIVKGLRAACKSHGTLTVYKNIDSHGVMRIKIWGLSSGQAGAIAASEFAKLGGFSVIFEFGPRITSFLIFLGKDGESVSHEPRYQKKIKPAPVKGRMPKKAPEPKVQPNPKAPKVEEEVDAEEEAWEESRVYVAPTVEGIHDKLKTHMLAAGLTGAQSFELHIEGVPVLFVNAVADTATHAMHGAVFAGVCEAPIQLLHCVMAVTEWAASSGNLAQVFGFTEFIPA